MINNLNNKLDLIERDIGLKSSLELQISLLDVREHLLDVWEELRAEEELSLTDRISKIEKYLTNKESCVIHSLLNLNGIKRKIRRIYKRLKQL